MADLDIREKVDKLEALSRKRVLGTRDKDTFIRLVAELDKVSGWEDEFPSLADYVEVTFNKFNDKDVIRTKVVNQLRSESSFLFIFSRAEVRTTTITQQWVRPRKKIAGRPELPTATSVILPPGVLKDAKAIQLLTTLWVRIEWDKAIIWNTIDNNKISEKLTAYLDYFNFLYTTEKSTAGIETLSSKQGKIKRYQELISSRTDWIQDTSVRRFLQFKYITAIHEDIIKDWFVLIKWPVAWTYELFKAKRGERNEKAPSNYVYRSLVTKTPGLEQAPDAHLDFAILWSVVEKDDQLLRGNASENSILVNILQKNKIQDITRIGIINPKTLTIDWNDVKWQIEKRISDAPLAVWAGEARFDTGSFQELTQSYQELMFLRDYIANERYLSSTYNSNLTSSLNEFRDYKARTAFIQWQIWAESDPQTAGGQVKKFIWNVLPAAIGLGLIGLLFSDTRKASFWWLAWLLAAYAWAPLLDKAWVPALNIWKVSILPGKVDFVKLNNITLTSDTPDRYKKVFSLMSGANKIIRDKRVWWDLSAQFVENDFVLRTIFETIVEKRNDLWGININDPDLTQTLFALFTWVEVRGNDNKSRAVKIEDLKWFVDILKKVKDRGDKTLLDALVADGSSIENTPFKKVNYTWVKVFDDKIHDTLSTDYGRSGLNVSQKEQILEIQILLWSLDKSVLARIQESIKSLDLTLLTTSVSDLEKLVDTLLTKIDADTVLDTVTKTKLRDHLEKYKKYVKFDALIQQHEGIFGGSGGSFIVNNFKTLTKISEDSEIKAALLKAIQELNIKLQIQWDEFKGLRERIDAILPKYHLQLLDGGIDTPTPDGKAALKAILVISSNIIKKKVEDNKVYLERAKATLESNPTAEWLKSILEDPLVVKAIKELKNYKESFSDTALFNFWTSTNQWKVITLVNDIFARGWTYETIITLSTTWLKEYFTKNKSLGDEISSVTVPTTAELTDVTKVWAFIRKVTALNQKLIEKRDIDAFFPKTQEILWIDYISLPNSSFTVSNLKDSFNFLIDSFYNKIDALNTNNPSDYESVMKALNTVSWFKVSISAKWLFWVASEMITSNPKIERLNIILKTKSIEIFETQLTYSSSLPQDTSVNLNRKIVVLQALKAWIQRNAPTIWDTKELLARVHMAIKESVSNFLSVIDWMAKDTAGELELVFIETLNLEIILKTVPENTDALAEIMRKKADFFIFTREKILSNPPVDIDDAIKLVNLYKKNKIASDIWKAIGQDGLDFEKSITEKLTVEIWRLIASLEVDDYTWSIATLKKLRTIYLPTLSIGDSSPLFLAIKNKVVSLTNERVEQIDPSDISKLEDNLQAISEILWSDVLSEFDSIQIENFKRKIKLKVSETFKKYIESVSFASPIGNHEELYKSLVNLIAIDDINWQTATTGWRSLRWGRRTINISSNIFPTNESFYDSNTLKTKIKSVRDAYIENVTIDSPLTLQDWWSPKTLLGLMRWLQSGGTIDASRDPESSSLIGWIANPPGVKLKDIINALRGNNLPKLDPLKRYFTELKITTGNLQTN